MSNKKQDNTKLLSMVWRGYNNKLSQIINRYIIVLISIFPIWTTNQYFHLLRDRYQFFWIATCMVTVSFFLITGWYLFRYLKERKYLGLRFGDESVAYPWKYFCQWINRLSITDIFLFSFLFVLVVSTMLSQWPRESFWGSAGRLQGLFLWFWYACAFFFISRYATSWKMHMRLIVVMGMGLSIWGVLDYMNLDPFHWLVAVKEGQRGMFMSSFGNINTYTAMMGIYMAISAMLFSRSVKCGERLWAAIALIAFFFNVIASITGQSDNAALGMMILFYFLPFFIWNDGRDIMSYLILIETAITGFGFVYIITSLFPNPYIGLESGLLLKLCKQNLLWIPFFVVGTLIFIVSRHRQNDTRLIPWLRGFWGIVGIVCTLIIMIVLWDVNHGGNREWYQPYKQWLYFSDSWGTYRGCCWRLGIEHFRNFNWINKLFGSGLETYGIIVKQANYQEMVDICGQIYDSPHNEPLQYLFTTGISGFICYYGFLFSGILKALRIKEMDCFEQKAAALTVLIYVGISIVNISVPIVTPYTILMTACLNGRRCEL